MLLLRTLALAASLSACAAPGVGSPGQPDLTFLRSLKVAAAEADAQRDYAAKGMRLLAVRGYALEIPAAPMPEALNLPYCVIEGTSDAIPPGPDGQTILNARNYAGVYNTMMLELAKDERRFDQTIRKGEACR